MTKWKQKSLQKESEINVNERREKQERHSPHASLNCFRLSCFLFNRCRRNKVGKGDHHRLIDRLMVEARKDGRKKESLNFIYKSMIKAKNIDYDYSYDNGMTGILNSCNDMKKKLRMICRQKILFHTIFLFLPGKKRAIQNRFFFWDLLFNFSIYFQFWFEILYFLTKIEKWKQFQIQ